MYGKKEEYSDIVMGGAITAAEVEHCRRNIRVGDSFTVQMVAEKGEQGKNIKRMKRGRVTAKYRHLVTLDCATPGTSVTYVQILQSLRRGRKYID